MRKPCVTAIFCRTDEAKITVRHIPDQPGAAARIFGLLAQSDILVDMIIQSQAVGSRATICFTVPESKAFEAGEAILTLLRKEWPGAALEVDKNLAKLSIVGQGMKVHTDLASLLFEVLGRENINIEMISTSDLKMSVAILGQHAHRAVLAVQEAFKDHGVLLETDIVRGDFTDQPSGADEPRRAANS